MIQKLSKNDFEKRVKTALSTIGVNTKRIKDFSNNLCTLSELHICHPISEEIDTMLSDIVGYKGCLPSDNMSELINYNFDDSWIDKKVKYNDATR